MSTIKLRPTFSASFTGESDELFARIRRKVAERADQFLGSFTSNHAMISLVSEERHFWSPWLTLEIRQSEHGKVLFGRFSPHPSIWTGFMFAYLALAVLTFFSIVLGSAQYLVSQSPWGFVLIPIWVAFAIALWVASQAGQRLSIAQMESLRGLIDEALGEQGL